MADLTDLSKTILPLDTFRKILGVEPYHFWQMDHAGRTGVGCGDCYVHDRWQAGDKPARSDFIDAIMSAESMFAGILQFWPGPKYETSEEIRILKPKQPVMYNVTPLKIFTKWRHVQNVGLLTLTLLEEDAVPTYIASDDVIITVANVPSAVQECEVVVTYPDTEVEIRPISVVISSGTATITIKKWLMLDRVNWEDADCVTVTGIAPFDVNMLATVDVYRKWVDPSQQITMAWEPNIYSCGCLDATCQTCMSATQTACASRGNYKEGAIGWELATWDAAEEEYNAASGPCDDNRFPDLAYINYKHGVAATNCYMDDMWSRLVSILAIAELDSSPCGCENVINFIRHWREDLGRAEESGSHILGSTDLENPWVLKSRGHLYAWRAVKQRIGG